MNTWNPRSLEDQAGRPWVSDQCLRVKIVYKTKEQKSCSNFKNCSWWIHRFCFVFGHIFYQKLFWTPTKLRKKWFYNFIRSTMVLTYKASFDGNQKLFQMLILTLQKTYLENPQAMAKGPAKLQSSSLHRWSPGSTPALPKVKHGRS